MRRSNYIGNNETNGFFHLFGAKGLEIYLFICNLLFILYNHPMKTWRIKKNFFSNTLFVYFGCAGSSLMHGLFSSCSELGLLFSCDAWAYHRGGFSCCGAAPLNSRGGRV